MVQIPTFEAPSAVPASPGLPRANPEVYAQPGLALAQGAERVGNVWQDFNVRYADARRQADASNILADATTQLGDAQDKWAKVPDRAAAQAGFDADAAQIRATTMSGITDPFVSSHVSSRLAGDIAARRLDTQRLAFGEESSLRRGQLDSRVAKYAQDAATASSDALRQQIVDNAMTDISGTVAGGWMHPEQGADAVLKFKSRVSEVQARQDINDNPARAVERLGDAAVYPDLLPNTREILERQASRRADAAQRERITAEDRAERQAALQLKLKQTSSEVTYIGQVAQGRTFTEMDLGDLVASQTVSPEGAQAIRRQQERSLGGVDTPSVVNDLTDRMVRNGEDIHDALLQARTRVVDERPAPTISGSTFDRMLKQNQDMIRERDLQQFDSAPKKQGYDYLRELMGAQELLSKFSESKQQLVAGASREYLERTAADPKADPWALADEIATTWGKAPPPRPVGYGVGTPKTADDINTGILRLRSARDSGAASPADYDRELRALRVWQQKIEQAPAASPKPGSK